jgi:hypothetical protein
MSRPLNPGTLDSVLLMVLRQTRFCRRRGLAPGRRDGLPEESGTGPVPVSFSDEAQPWARCGRPALPKGLPSRLDQMGGSQTPCRSAITSDRP